MAIYAISDLHLSLAVSKPMDIFGSAWENHVDKIRENWQRSVSEGDTVLIAGDISWAMRLEEAMPDLNFLAELPGKKILIRGNHDYWWQRKATNRIQRIVDRNLTFLQGTSTLVDGIAITGTRGWRIDWESRAEHVPEVQQDEIVHSEKIFQRELTYLKRGLESIPPNARMKIAMLHYPPFDERLQLSEFARLLKDYSVDILVYGHVHLGLGGWLEGTVDGVRYYMVSADIIGFTPRLIVP
jgi:predicted phosphohydrolase